MPPNSQEQKALIVAGPGFPFELTTRPIPDPEPGDLLVKVQGIGLNPAEWKIQTQVGDMTSLGATYPMLVGTDGAGTVVKVGEGVQDFREGDRVFFQGWYSQDRSTYQEYTLVYADLAAKIPPSMTFLEACSIPLCLATAALGLTIPYVPGEWSGGAGLVPFWDPKSKSHYHNQPVVILGGASGIGQFAIQIVKYLGFSPIIATASLKNTAYLKSLGATHVVDRFCDVNSAINAILEDHSGPPLSVVLDTVNTPITQKEVDLLPPGGILVTIWALPKKGADPVKVPPPVGLLPEDSSLEFTGNRKAIYIFGSVHAYNEEGRKMYSALTKLLEEGVLKPLRIEKLPGGLGAIPKGLERLRNEGGSAVKVVVDPTESNLVSD